MKALATYSVALVWLAMALDISADARVVLTLRLYNTSAIPAAELLAARNAAQSAFRDAGLDVIFRHCGRPAASQILVEPCDEHLNPREVVVRIIDAPAFSPSLHPEAYGMAYLVRATDRGWLATVFSDRIGSAASRVRVDAGTLLGLVMAHEVGHLLLGSDYHSQRGVMRADWQDGLLNHMSDEYRFSTLEAARMRQAASNAF
jgi:hypothetical protein